MTADREWLVDWRRRFKTAVARHGQLIQMLPLPDTEEDIDLDNVQMIVTAINDVIAEMQTLIAEATDHGVPKPFGDD
jgi:hypothetical protein